MKLVKILFVIITVLVIGNVTLTNRNVDESIVVADFNRQISSLQNQNTILTAQIAELGSISHLTDQVEAAGFVSSPNIAAIRTVPVVALR